MIDLLYYAGAALLGGLAGLAIGSLIAKYWEQAKEWFGNVWRSLRRVSRGVGLLVRKGQRLFKRFLALLLNGEVEEYYDESDTGVEISRDDLTTEALKALDEDGYLVAEVYES